MKDKDKQTGKMEENLKVLGAKIDALAAKTETVGNDLKTDYKKRIVDLKQMHTVTRSRLEEMKSASNEKWGAFKSGLDKAWIELEATFKTLSE